MASKDLILSIATIILLLTTIIFMVRANKAEGALEEAESMSELLAAHLVAKEYHRLYPVCQGVAPGHYERLTQCLSAAAAGADLTRVFKREEFRNAREEADGYLIIENAVGDETFESDAFTLHQNNELLATGCTTSGEIAPGYTCRFDLSYPCEPGDNLEIKYEGERAYLYTC